MKKRILVAMLTMSLAGYAFWDAQESFRPDPHIPTKGDKPTIGLGSTRYEDGRLVKLSDPPITRKRAIELARNLNKQEEQRLIRSLPGVYMTQEEFDLYMDFVGQYGSTTFHKSSMRRYLLAGDHVAACNALLKYKYAAGYDCSTKGNKRCSGVWKRQLARHKKCMESQ